MGVSVFTIIKYQTMAAFRAHRREIVSSMPGKQMSPLTNAVRGRILLFNLRLITHCSRNKLRRI